MGDNTVTIFISSFNPFADSLSTQYYGMPRDCTGKEQLGPVGTRIRHASLDSAAIVNLQVTRHLPSFFHVPESSSGREPLPLR